MFENYGKKQIEENVKTLMLLEYLGVHIEDVKQIADEYGIFSKTIYYFSVPETSTIELDTATDEMSAKIKCADGLISLAKEEILDMLLDACKSEFGDDEEFIQEIKDNSSDYFKFYAKVRNVEVWNKELGDAAIKKLTEDIKVTSSYKEV